VRSNEWLVLSSRIQCSSRNSRYSSRNQTVRFAYVSSLRVKRNPRLYYVNQMHYRHRSWDSELQSAATGKCFYYSTTRYTLLRVGLLHTVKASLQTMFLVLPICASRREFCIFHPKFWITRPKFSGFRTFPFVSMFALNVLQTIDIYLI
jgi:hypothetical protein